MRENDLLLEVDAELVWIRASIASAANLSYPERSPCCASRCASMSVSPQRRRLECLSLGKALQRAGAHVAPDQKPATAAEGLAFRARFNSIGADYFATVGLPILRGRAFSAGEATQSEGMAVAVIDETLAKNLWPDGDALGQHLQYRRGQRAARERRRRR